MQRLRQLADNRESDSLATQMRRKRFMFFLSLMESAPRPLRILDVGGTPGFWLRMDPFNFEGIQLVLLNLQPQTVDHPAMTAMGGDATNMPQFSDGEFDVVFSNSVIEHVGPLEAQQRMAAEVQRVGQRYFIQTPNRYFPIEPHFLVPFFQFLPLSLRVWMAMHFNLGWYKKFPDKAKATAAVSEIRLLTRNEMARMFPTGQIYEEKLLGLTKSFVAYGGWEAASER